MSLVIRFTRTGRKSEAKFRVVVKEKRSKRDGAAIDTLGYYTRGVKTFVRKIDMDKLSYWKKQGAQVSPAVEKALAKEVASAKTK